MNDLLMVDAALFQLRAAMSMADDPALAPMRLGLEVLEGAVTAARDGINAARVNDLDFAVSDLLALAEGLGAAAADQVLPPLQMLQQDVARLREQTALAPAVLAAIQAFQTKLRARRSAIERNTFRAEGTPELTLPHPPEELHAEGMALRTQLNEAGFAAPALDAFLADPSTLRFHTLGEMADELDVIAGR